MVKALLALEKPMITMPKDTNDKANSIIIFKWKQEYEEKKQLKMWAEKNKKTYNLVLQHNLSEMQSEVDARSGYSTVKADQDGIKMMKMIQSMCHQHDKSKQRTMAVVCLDKSAYLINAGTNSTPNT